VNLTRRLSGCAALQCGKALPFRARFFLKTIARLRLAKGGHSLQNQSKPVPVRQSLTALRSGRAVSHFCKGLDAGVYRIGVTAPGYVTCALIVVFLTGFPLLNSSSSAQQRRRTPRSGAHSAIPREVFTAEDRSTVERAIGTACAERIRDPYGSTPIDEMQARPSLSVRHPDAMAGARRAERLLLTTKKLVASSIIRLAKDYNLYQGRLARARINAATARVEAVRRVRPDVDARDNASVLLRDPRTIEFGTIFLAGLRSDEAMISVLAHELTHVASGQTDSLRPLFLAIARRATARTGLRIRGQRAEELACDLVGVMAARAFIKGEPSWEPQPRRLARAVEHNCVDDDSSDEDHLSPRNTIRALFALDLDLARQLLVNDNALGFLTQPAVARASWRVVFTGGTPVPLSDQLRSLTVRAGAS
jgi:hypothetical protein